MFDKEDCMNRDLSVDDLSMHEFNMQAVAANIVLTTFI